MEVLFKFSSRGPCIKILKFLCHGACMIFLDGEMKILYEDRRSKHTHTYIYIASAGVENHAFIFEFASFLQHFAAEIRHSHASCRVLELTRLRLHGFTAFCSLLSLGA